MLILFYREPFPNCCIVFAPPDKNSYNTVVWCPRRYKPLKGEKTNERIKTLYSCSIDVHWCLELGTGWNLWIWLGGVSFWAGYIVDQHCIQPYWDCRGCVVDSYHDWSAILNKIIKQAFSCHSPRPFGAFFLQLLILKKHTEHELFINKMCKKMLNSAAGRLCWFQFISNPLKINYFLQPLVEYMCWKPLMVVVKCV